MTNFGTFNSESFMAKMKEAMDLMRAQEEERTKKRAALEEKIQEELVKNKIEAPELSEDESKRLTEALTNRRATFEKFRQEASKSPRELFDEYRQSQVTQGKSVKNKIMRFLDSMAYYRRGGDAVAYKYSQDQYDKNRKFLNTELKEEERTLKEIETDLNKRKTTNVKMDLDAQKAEATRVSRLVTALQRALERGDKAGAEQYKRELDQIKLPLETQQALAGIASKYASDNALSIGLNSGSVPQSVMQNRENVLSQKELVKQKYAPQLGLTTAPDKYTRLGMDELGNPAYGWIPGGQRQTKVPLDKAYIQAEMDKIKGQVPQQPGNFQPQLPQNITPQQPGGFTPQSMQQTVPPNTMPPRAQVRPQNQPGVKVQDLGNKVLPIAPGDKYGIPKAPPKLDPMGRPITSYPGLYGSKGSLDSANAANEFSGSLTSTLTTMAGGFKQPSSTNPGVSVATSVFGSLFNNPNSTNTLGTASELLSLIKAAVQRDSDKVYSAQEIQDISNRFLGKFKDGTAEKNFANRVIPSMTQSIMNYVVNQSGKQINQQELKLYQGMFANIVADTSQSAFQKMLNFSSKMLITDKLKKAGYGFNDIYTLVNSPQFNAALNKKNDLLARNADGVLGGSTKFELSDINPVNILGDIMEENNFTLPGGGRIERLIGGKRAPQQQRTRRPKNELRNLF